MPRIPSPAQVASLSRTEWEQLCRSLAAIIYQAEGVEDQRGKGNGLDMIRIDPDGARGWQFRRFDDRFGDAQAAKVLSAVRLAATRCLQEDKVKLVEFSLWANIDLEPGHKKSTGERERFATLAATAKAELGVTVRFVGLTWVHAELLMRPTLHPSLFEDVAAQVSAVQQQLKELATNLLPLRGLASDASKSSDDVRSLVEQALLHYERGKMLGAGEHLQSARQCFSDALGLLKGSGVDPRLEGRVLLALAGVEKLLGHLPEAEVAARRSIELLANRDPTALAQARGALALVLEDQQRYKEAAPLLREVLAHFESQPDPIELVRSLTHVVELHINRGKIDDAHALSTRLHGAVRDLEQLMGGPSDVSTAGTGALARVTFELGKESESREMLRAAEQSFTELVAAGRVLRQPHMVFAALMGKAEAVRYQDRLEDAEALLRDAIAEAEKGHLAKMKADGLYTLALIQEERNRITDALASMTAAGTQYQQLNDTASAEDAAEQLHRISTSPAPLVAKEKKAVPPTEPPDWPLDLKRMLAAYESLPLSGAARDVATFILDRFDQTRARVSAQAVELGFAHEVDSLAIANQLADKGYVKLEAAVHFSPALELVAAKAERFSTELTVLDSLLRNARAIYETPDATRRVSIDSYLTRLASDSQRSVFRLLCFSLEPYLFPSTGSSSTNVELEIRAPIRTINGIADCVEARSRRHAPPSTHTSSAGDIEDVAAAEINGDTPTSPRIIDHVDDGDAEATKVDLLLVVAPDVEHTAVMNAARAIGRCRTSRLMHGAERTYDDLGIIGGARVAIVQTRAGTSTVGGSLSTIKTAIYELKPVNIVMVGIAFGVDPEKQPVGTVLVSERVHQYQIERIGTDEKGQRHRIKRGDTASASPTVISRLKSANRKQPARVGLVLSGEPLIDNYDYREELRAAEPEAIGGEMEGGGLYVAATEAGRRWCIVKAVSDWADGNKRANKEERQRVAARKAAEFVMRAIVAGGFASRQSQTAESTTTSAHVGPIEGQASKRASRAWWLVAGLVALGAAAVVISKLWPSPAEKARDDTATASAATVRLLLGRTETDPVFWLYNESRFIAEAPTYEMRLYDLSVNDPLADGTRLALRVRPGKAGPILPGRTDPSSPHSIRSLAEMGSSLAPGHVVFGIASIACANCATRRDFWVWVKIGHSGWSHEIGPDERRSMEEILNSAISGPTLFDPDRWISPSGSVPAAQHVREGGWVWVPAGKPVDPSAAPMRQLFGWKTWTGGLWRDYQLGDEAMNEAIMAPSFSGTGSIDPDFPVVTKEAAMKTVDEMHSRFHRN